MNIQKRAWAWKIVHIFDEIASSAAFLLNKRPSCAIPSQEKALGISYIRGKKK